MTFDVRAAVYLGKIYDWQRHFELCAQCRQCDRPSLFRVSDAGTNTKNIIDEINKFVSSNVSVNQVCNIDGPVSFVEISARKSPDFLPADVTSAFNEGARCLAVECYNAAAAMFRLSIDLATKPLLPAVGDHAMPAPTSQQRRNLGLRLPWMFENNILPKSLSELAACIKEDGNDGVHDGSLAKEDAEDLMDFSFELHERLFTEPERLRLAAKRRVARRAP